MKKKNKFQVLNPTQQGLLGIIKKSYSIYLWGGACNLEPVQSICGWAMSWYYKGFEPLFSRRKKKRKIDSNYIPFWKRQNYGDNKKINDFQEFVGR